MKLAPINREHILKAGESIDYNGIPKNYLSNWYWVQLPNGKEYPFSHLTRTAFQFSEEYNNEELDFESNESYRAYLTSLGFSINYHKEGIPFFTTGEVKHFLSIAGTKYRSENTQNVLDSKRLTPIVKKMNVWAEQSLIEDFEFKKDHGWQWSGTFKSYLWIRLYRQGTSRKVYFFVAINENGEFEIKIDCQRSNHTGGSTKPLPKNLIMAFDKYRDTSGYQPVIIPFTSITDYNWDTFIELTQNYLHEYAPLIDELENLITREVPNIPEKEYVLTKTPPPTNTNSRANAKRKFKGKKTDWSKKHSTSMKLGSAGEELVKRYEKRKLEALDLHEKALLVQKKLDGEGYDLLSFDKEENELHIEIKTTTNGLSEPFYMSLNEVAYFKEYPENYYLYRLYNYNPVTKSANFYILKAEELMKQDFNPTNYEVVINNSKEQN